MDLKHCILPTDGLNEWNAAVEYLKRGIAACLDRAFRYQKAASKPLYQAHIRYLHHEINWLHRPSDKAAQR
jgi:hypothetical protein